MFKRVNLTTLFNGDYVISVIPPWKTTDWNHVMFENILIHGLSRKKTQGWERSGVIVIHWNIYIYVMLLYIFFKQAEISQSILCQFVH